VIFCGETFSGKGCWVSVGEMKALAVKMETVTLFGKGRQNVTCFVYRVYEIGKILYLGRHFIRAIILDLDTFRYIETLYLFLCLFDVRVILDYVRVAFG